jgi:hypothetical protein
VVVGGAERTAIPLPAYPVLLRHHGDTDPQDRPLQPLVKPLQPLVKVELLMGLDPGNEASGFG